jgi:hypothetical protein
MRDKRARGKHEKRPVIDTGSVIARGASGSVVVRGPAGGTVRRGGGSGARLLVFVAVLFGLYWIVGTFRHELVERVPGAYPLLKAIGYELEEPAGYGLRIQAEGTRTQDENRQWIVYVRGYITNTTDHRVSVPRLRITVEASNSRPLSWTVEPELSSLAPGQRIEIRSRYNTTFALRNLRTRVRFETR